MMDTGLAAVNADANPDRYEEALTASNKFDYGENASWDLHLCACSPSCLSEWRPGSVCSFPFDFEA